MDWTVILVQCLATAVTVCGTLILPALAFAFKYGELSMRQRKHEEKCEGECERQSREHSRLFQRTEEHAQQIASIQGDVKGLDRRITVLEE